MLEDASGLALAALDGARMADDDELARTAVAILTRARELFYDGDGTWYMTPNDAGLPARPREQHDGATPSGASMAALAAVRIAADDPAWAPVAEDSLARLIPLVERSPFSAGTGLVSLIEALSGAEADER